LRGSAVKNRIYAYNIVIMIMALLMICALQSLAFAVEAFPAPMQPLPNVGEGLLMQRWTVDAFGGDGSRLCVIFELANFSENDRLKEMTGQSLKSTSAYVKAEYTAPDGKRRNIEQAAGGDWSFNSSQQLLGVASSSLKREKSVFKLNFESDDMRIEAVLKPLDGPWKPAGEKAVFGNARSRFYDLILFAPRAEIKGAVRLRDLGQSVEKKFSGDAMLSYQASNIRTAELSKRWLKVVFFDKKNTVIFGGLAQPASTKGISHSWLYIKKSGNPALTFNKSSVKFGNPINGEHYAVPQNIEIKAGNGAGALKLVLQNENVIRRIEGLDQRENIHGFVARQFSKPVEYELECSAAIEGAGATAEFKSFKPFCSMLYLNP